MMNPYQDHPIRQISLDAARLEWWNYEGNRVEVMITRASVLRSIDNGSDARSSVNLVIEVREVETINMQFVGPVLDVLTDMEITMGNEKSNDPYAKSGESNADSVLFYFSGGASLEFICKSFRISRMDDEEFVEIWHHIPFEKR